MQSQGLPETELWKVPERSVYLLGAVGAYLWGRHGQPSPSNMIQCDPEGRKNQSLLQVPGTQGRDILIPQTRL